MTLKLKQYCLQSVLPLFLAFAIVFLTTFSNVLEVDAAGITETTKKTGTWTWNINYTNLSPDNANTIHSPTIAVDDWTASSDEQLDQEWWQWYQYNGTQSIFTTSKNAYAYKITLSVPTTFKLNSSAQWHRVALGTLGEIFAGECVFGTTFSSNMAPSMWYISENAEKNIYLGIYSKFTTLYMDGGFVPNNFVSSGSAPFTVTEFTKAEYVQQLIESNKTQNSLITQSNNKLDTSNTLQSTANSLQETANKTSQGILDSISSFFGSFFDNLIDSVIRIFVPTQDELNEKINGLVSLFQESLGFLLFPLELIVNLVSVFIDTPADITGARLTLPGFKILGFTVWEPYEFRFGQLEEVQMIFVFVRMVTGAVMSFAFIDYLRRFFDKRFGGGGN